MVNVAGQQWSKGMLTGAVTHMRNSDGRDVWIVCHDPSKGCSPRWGSKGKLVLDDGSTAIKAVKHTMSDGNTMTAVSYMRSNNRATFSYRYKSPIRNGSLKSEAWKYTLETNK